MSTSPTPGSTALNVYWLGQLDYELVWQSMQTFTRARTDNSEDEIWLVEHPPVYTLGMACKDQTVKQPNNIAVIKTDRGGQITYHGPGQIVAYVLVDLRRLQWGIRKLVETLEQTVIDLLSGFDIDAERHQGAPGLYVDGKKIAALGLRVRHGCSYHGIAINVDMALEPFGRINPCGYPGLEVTQLRDLGVHVTTRDIGTRLSEILTRKLGYNSSHIIEKMPDLIRNA